MAYIRIVCRRSSLVTGLAFFCRLFGNMTMKECGFRSQKTATTPLNAALIATPSRIVLNQFTIKNPPYHSAKAFFSFLSMSIRVSLHSFGCSFPALNMKETSSPEPTGSIIFSMDCGNAKCVPCL